LRRSESCGSDGFGGGNLAREDRAALGRLPLSDDEFLGVIATNMR